MENTTTKKKAGRPSTVHEICLLDSCNPASTASGCSARYYSPDKIKAWFGSGLIQADMALKLFPNERQARVAFRLQRLARALDVAPSVGRVVKISRKNGKVEWGYETTVAPGKIAKDCKHGNETERDIYDWCKTNRLVEKLGDVLRTIGLGDDLHNSNVHIGPDRKLWAIDFSWHSCDGHNRTGARGYPPKIESVIRRHELRLRVGSPQGIRSEFVGPPKPSEKDLVLG